MTNQLGAGVVPDETDLIVVGAGSAGTATAIAARELGAEVLLVEKSAAPGGMSRYSGGNLLELTGPPALVHLRALTLGRTPVSVLSAYLEGLGELRRWLEELGAATTTTGPSQDGVQHCWPNLPGADAVRFYGVQGPEGQGRSLWRVLESALAERGVRPVCQARATELVTADGRVRGVRADIGGSTRTIRARAGVVLTTGGFENSPELCDTYLPVGSVQAILQPENTGDGLLMAQAVGASLWHMSNFFGFWSFKAPGHAVAFGIRAAVPSYLMVDQGGRRFAAEAGREPHDTLRILGDFSPVRRHTPGFPVYLVFDANALNAGPLAWTASPDGYQWSKDNGAEIKAGWVSAAATGAELAEPLAVPPDVLAETIAAFNRVAASGSDTDFGRPADSMRPLAEGPLYAIPLMPGVGTTAGGPRRDDKARVLDRTGKPIPGLFAAGDNGSVWGYLIEHGGALTDGLVFGRIAAAEALKARES